MDYSLLKNFIEKAKAVHEERYDYSEVNYKNSKTKVCIICPDHGEFWQRPEKHLIGQGCPKCSSSFKKTQEDFIKKAKEIHGEKYDYSKVFYSNSTTPVCIICPVHGEFWQTPKNHLKGKGCPECGKLKTKPLKYNAESFIEKAKELYGEQYDYSKVDYKNISAKVIIICPEHGEFLQTPYTHLQGKGCPECGKRNAAISKRSTTEGFIEKAKSIYGEKYDYSKVEYITAKNKVCIICPEHGEFWQSPWHHLNGSGCPKCINPSSKAELELFDFVCSLVGKENVEQHNRTILNGKELDVFIPSMNVAIEYNGLYWHSENTIPRDYHYSKMMECKKRGIKLIQVFEDEFVSHKEIVFSKISHLLGKDFSLPKIMARKCSVQEIKTNIAKDFLNKNHIQGFGSGTVYLGAFFNSILVGVMAFKKELNKWELTRFASDNQVICQGLGGKLFSYFIKNYSPLEIKSFADRRWTINEDDNLYTKLGFAKEGFVIPDYHYYRPSDGPIRHHKFGFRKQILKKKFCLPLSMTEREMTEKLGYVRIYDCGLIKYVWRRG